MIDHRPLGPQTLVLVVDDQPSVARMLTEALEAYGYEVESVANGLRALDKLAGRAYDLIISDLRMPELDGVGLYREIQQRHPALLSRLLFVGGMTEEPEYQRFLAESAAPVLAKPFGLADLYRLTREVLATHRHEPEGA